MKTKKIIHFLGALAFAGMITSCSNSGSLASNFGKRKYTQGHFNDVPGSYTNPSSVATASKAKATESNTSVVANKPETQHSAVINTSAPKTTTEKSKNITNTAPKTADMEDKAHLSGNTNVANHMASVSDKQSSIDNAQYSNGGSKFDWKHHKVAYILIGLLIILILVLYILTGGQGYNSRGN